MGARATRTLIDVAFASAVITCAVAAATVDTHEMPANVCAATSGEPRYAELLADGRVTIGVVIAELDEQPPGHRELSHRYLVEALSHRGFVETRAGHYEREELAIDVELVDGGIDRISHERIGRAVTAALATHEVVYYNGHSERGELPIVAPDDAYRIIVLDSCWTTQLYSARLVGPHHDVIANTGRSITGSVESLPILVDALANRTDAWSDILAKLDARAITRADERQWFSIYRHPERYRLDVACSTVPPCTGCVSRASP